MIATIKSWNIENSEKIIRKYPEEQFILITDKNKLTEKLLCDVKPRFVFFPHWSWIIPQEIYEKYPCVVFHMTDLPFGRGGSPLQNLLVRGIYKTKISAVRVSAGIDAGPVYFKEDLDISDGSADDIYRKASDIIFQKMIPHFLHSDVDCQQQNGNPVIFKRRTAEQSELPENLSLRQIYDYIRMLDGEGYPAAYQKTAAGKVYYRNARLKNNVLYADAEFRGENN